MKNDFNIQHHLIEAYFKGKVIAEKEGNSGKVYILENPPGTIPKKIAVKTVKDISQDRYAFFLDEIKKWYTSNNSYLVTPFQTKYVNEIIHISMPFFDDDLKSFLLKNTVDEVASLIISLQIVKGLQNLKKYGIHHHQDLNPPNILIEDVSKKIPNYNEDIPHKALNYLVRISDLGNANLMQELGESGRVIGGKHPYKAPEQYRKAFYSAYEPDIFALGVMICMFFTNQHPIGVDASKVLSDYSLVGDGNYWKNWAFSDKMLKIIRDPELRILLELMLNADPSVRPDLETIYGKLHFFLSERDIKSANYLIFLFNYFDELDSN